MTALETVIRGFSWHEYRRTAGALIRAFQHWAVLGEFAPRVALRKPVWWRVDAPQTGDWQPCRSAVVAVIATRAARRGLECPEDVGNVL